MSRSQISHSAPLIIGHRGSPRYAPENTIASFDMAIEEGADGIEFDVRLARDQEPVVIHDASLLRTAGVECPAEDFDSALLAKFYVGAWYNERYPKFARSRFASEQIPTLAQVFERYGAHHLYVEMKCEEPSRRADLARAVVRLMREHGLGERGVVKSFEHHARAEVKRVAP